MQHLGTKVLKTPRLTLRPFTVADAQPMFDNWASDPEVTKFLTWPTHTSVEVSRAVLADWVGSYASPDVYQWAIVLNDESPAPIGSIAVVERDDAVQKVQVGYCIGKKWWHRGITSEALRAVRDYLFNEVGVNRIEALHDPRNAHSGNVMKKCDLRYEGTLRQAVRNNQGICDAAYYAILKSDPHA